MTSARIGAALLTLALSFGAVGVLTWTETGYADEDNIKDQVVVVNTQTAIDIPYKFGNIAQGADLIKIVPLRDAQQLLVAGRKAGTTNIIVYDTRGVMRDSFEITVIPGNLSKVMENVQELLDDVEGLSFKIVNDRVYIQGEVSLDEELQRVDDLSAREPLVESMVTLSPVAQRLLAGLIEQEIDIPNVNARLVNNQIILEGVVHSEADYARAEAIARAFYEDIINVLDYREVERIPGRAPTLVVIVHFVELSKSLTTTWGVEWTPLAMNDTTELFFQRDYENGWADTSGYATASLTSFLPRLDAARTSGYARVLENPTVSVKSGDSARIFSGLEYPFVVTEGLNTTVEFRDVGIDMQVVPYAQGNDIDMNINVEFTSLGEVAANGYQTITKSTLTTSQFCRAGESIVIGGLSRVSDSTDYNRLPAYVEGSIYTLYKNKQFKKSKSQFLVFLTPQVHESSSAANKEIKDQFNLDEVRQ